MMEKNLDNLDVWYSPIGKYVKSCNELSYLEFDNDVVSKCNLFASIENINFKELEEKIDLITETIPAIKRIFAKPIIHLVENDEILPVEAVRTVNNKTIQYASSHSENWANITRSGIKPLKLLSRNYIDNYSIYENIVFARSIDYILNFTRHTSHLLKDLISTNQKLEINLLEKENHISYFLALGKLQTGYIRSFSKYLDEAIRCIDKLDYITNVLTARLKNPVYARNKRFKGKLNLHKTNILSMQKDYKKIYSFMKRFYIEDINEDIEVSNSLKENYFYYTMLLTIFSIGHFNFKKDDKLNLNFTKLDSTFTFNSYNLNIKKVSIENNNAIELKFFKNKEYKILLTPLYKLINDSYDEVIEISPFESNDSVFVSINNIESFRRLQQIIERGMLYSDTKRDICPFCGSNLTFNNKTSEYRCNTCMNVVKDVVCPKTKKVFISTRIFNYKNTFKEKIEDTKDNWTRNRLIESQLHFRNINMIDNEAYDICPYCKEVHIKIK